ncbi:MAG: prepilin-type N-terminal cleavage/methylation domain-containing protein [Deltaproteobacteria bacterium]|nr:prepilin-type N-terminal cleavage/methylation domain-containing protein [Deltaproteobacteria bacterium]
MNDRERNHPLVPPGFTLIEILVVLILMSLIAGISTVFFAGTLPKAKQRAQAREIVSTIKYARTLAASTQERQVVTFDLDTGKYGIKGRTGKAIPDEMRLAIDGTEANTGPVRKGQYSLYYDATGTNTWGRIHLIQGDRIIRIVADPILTAVIADDEQDKRHD